MEKEQESRKRGRGQKVKTPKVPYLFGQVPE